MPARARGNQSPERNSLATMGAAPARRRPAASFDAIRTGGSERTEACGLPSSFARGRAGGCGGSLGAAVSVAFYGLALRAEKSDPGEKLQDARHEGAFGLFGSGGTGAAGLAGSALAI